MDMDLTKVPVPGHVPSELVVDFNVYGPENGKYDLPGAWRKLSQDARPFVWSPYHGGHWIPTRFEDIDFIQRNHDPFSMRDVTMPSGLKPFRLLPLEADPPEHLGFRMIINPYFTPRKIADLEQHTRDLAIELIETLQPKGQCEFIEDFAVKLPIAIFMRLGNLPMADAPELLRFAEMATRGGAAMKAQSQELMLGYIMPVIEERKKNPGDDVLSAIIHGNVRKNPIEFVDMISMILIILFGGLDTVTSTMGFMANFLANHSDHRKRLIEEPDIVPAAVNEMMRRFGPSNTARTLSRDFDYKGVHFIEGDKVYVAAMVAGMDETHFTNAWEIDFDRKEGEHASFGAGPHRCPGQLLALLELRIFVEEWLKRIPNFRVSAAIPPTYAPGQVNCVAQLELEWDV
jgi:cytochrome P450